MRRPSIQDLEDLINKPSVPLKPHGDEGPPQILDAPESNSAIEGLILIQITIIALIYIYLKF